MSHIYGTMKHENEIFCQPRGILTLIVLILIGNSFISCKSYKNAVEETRTEFYYTGRDSTQVDSVLIGGNERNSESDTTSVSTGASGTVEIKRDSAGRAIKIIWTRSALVSTLSKRDTEKERWFYGLNATRHSESSGAVDYVNEKTEETTEVINTTISLENIIGPGLLGLVLLYLIYVFFADIVWPWIKQKRSR